ncbi:hypothetical protein BpHYR1_018231 [Brachionus plicatilis]|uniref:Uncharacterized protein n=1 Tax=Brachionus plicatilis TaxID=10195 RepID=A0A3M7QWY2_BRAPC|nr:hypothetical protein BpHYR1_018231 [Brachionus plicatilis]
MHVKVRYVSEFFDSEHEIDVYEMNENCYYSDYIVNVVDHISCEINKFQNGLMLLNIRLIKFLNVFPISKW